MKLNKNDVFVFGSNEAGIHGGGAARYAKENLGAEMGFSYGKTGQCFAIPTKDIYIETLPLGRIKMYVTGFLAFAIGHKKLTFKITQIGCGLAGYTANDIAPMFKNAPLNCQFDSAWQLHMGDQYTYWGTG